MYLRIISYGQEILGQDWSELPIPDFNILGKSTTPIGNQIYTLELFSSIIIFAAQTLPSLKVEIDCIIAALPNEERAYTIETLEAVHTSRTFIFDL